MDIPGAESEIVAPKARKGKFKIYLLYTSALCLGLFAANKFFKLITKVTERDIESLKAEKTKITVALQTENAIPAEISKTEKPLPSGISAAQYESSLIVNGVFLSPDGKRYALVNNRIVKEGDNLEGLRLVRISLDGLELEDPQGLIIKLKAETR
ncbi:MAG: hypothetical protein ABIA66_01640 [Candidatus Omnitrophota bacterium]